MTKLEEIVVAGVTYSVHVQHRFEIHLSFIRHKRPKTQKQQKIKQSMCK